MSRTIWSDETHTRVEVTQHGPGATSIVSGHAQIQTSIQAGKGGPVFEVALNDRDGTYDHGTKVVGASVRLGSGSVRAIMEACRRYLEFAETQRPDWFGLTDIRRQERIRELRTKVSR